MASVACVSEVRIERVKGPLRRAWLPAEAGRAYGLDAENCPVYRSLKAAVTTRLKWREQDPVIRG